MDKSIEKLIREYIREYKQGNFNEANIVAEKLAQYNIETIFSNVRRVDCIIFSDWHTNKILHWVQL